MEEAFRDEREGQLAYIQNQIDSFTEFPTLYPLGRASRGLLRRRAKSRNLPGALRCTGPSLLSAFDAESLNCSLAALKAELRSAGELA
jgi:hypothetical protein